MELTIIVPVYNKEQYLVECVTSILKQTKQDIRLFLMDDGSTDKSLDICRNLAAQDDRISVFHHDHKGVIRTRAEGVEKANTEYVTFVDADDFIDSKSFDYADPFMEDRVDIIFFGMKRYFNGRTSEDSLPLSPGIYRGEILQRKLKANMLWSEARKGMGIEVSLCNKIFRRELLRKVYQELKDNDFHYGEDIAAVFSAVDYASSIVVTEHAYYNHRLRQFPQIGPYFEDPNFYEKLFSLYKFLVRRFGDEQTRLVQIEKLYLNCVKQRLYALYRIREEDEVRYIFPFDRVQKGSRVIIYGAGRIGRIFMQELSLLHYCEIVLWVDENESGEGISKVEEIVNTEFDYVVIAVKNIEYRSEIKKRLQDLKVDIEKAVFLQGV